MTVLTDAGVRAAGSSRQTRQRLGLRPSTGGTVPRAQAQSAAEQALSRSSRSVNASSMCFGLLLTDLDGPEIARHLVVSLSTVRTHTQNIFNKLGVNNRRAAVRRAAELDFVANPQSLAALRRARASSIITSIITCDEAYSSHPPLSSEHDNSRGRWRKL